MLKRKYCNFDSTFTCYLRLVVISLVKQQVTMISVFKNNLFYKQG